MKYRLDFNRPPTREILQYLGVKEIPRKINNSYLLRGLNSGDFNWVLGGRTYADVAKTYQRMVEGDGRTIVVLPSSFRFPKDEINKSLKSLEGLAKADSVHVLRQIERDETAIVPKRITQEFALGHRKKFPRSYFRRAIENCDIENPPMGVYWARSDGHFSGFTFLDAVGGAEMERMRQEGVFDGEVIDSRPYAGSFRVMVGSGTEPGVKHKVNFSRLPIHRWGSDEQFYSWVDMEQTSTDENTFFVGEAHKRRRKTLTIWSRPVVFAFYTGADFIKQHPEFKVHYRMNPFCIPQDEEIMKIIDHLRFRSLIFHEEGGDRKSLTLHPLNKGEINRVVGAITIDKGYNNTWFHWGKRDLSYLFTPPEFS